MPSTLKYEPSTIVAENDFVIVHGRFFRLRPARELDCSGHVRIEDGILVEHWDVIQDEATRD